jgi:hypothetical protein
MAVLQALAEDDVLPVEAVGERERRAQPQAGELVEHIERQRPLRPVSQRHRDPGSLTPQRIIRPGLGHEQAPVKRCGPAR